METWVALIVLAVGGVILAVAGLWVYVSATTRPLHPDAGGVPHVAHADPSGTWADAVGRARTLMRAGVAEQNLPGLSVAVGARGSLVWAEGFGYADLERRLPVAPNHRFRIGTASIVLTSAAAGLLVEQQRLELDREIQSYLPEFPRKPWPVTVRELMAHVSGVRNDSGDEGPLFSQQCARPADAFPSFAERDLLFQPGTQYRYSSYGWIVVSAAIEAAANEPFLTFMQKQIFRPLGMDDTIAESAEAIPDRASSYFPRFAADTRYGPDPMRDIGLTCYAGASAFVSTPSDLIRFGLAIQSAKWLQPATVTLLQTPQRLADGTETGYGLGWDLETVTIGGRPTRVAGHDGEVLGGRVASLMVVPERGLVVAVVSNTSYADTASLALQIAETFVEPDL